MIIERLAKKIVHKYLKPNKVILLLGIRRSGKTFLLEKIKENTSEKLLFWNGENVAIQAQLQRRSIQNYTNLIGDTKFLIIDEAQKIPFIGEILKLMIDSVKNLKIIATGSSAIDLAGSVGEPLVGRKYDIYLYPISEQEIAPYEEITQRLDNLKMRLVYGSMPELLRHKNFEDKEEYLRQLINSYLIRDILQFNGVKNSAKIFDMLKLIAFQMGNEVSLEKIGRQLGMSKNSVERYLDLLSKVYLIFKIRGYSRNLRKEVTKHAKWYFVDNGIRNAIINNFNPLELRDDVGALWENYMISERIKYQNYNRLFSNNYFWRTYDQQEIDWIEERGGKLFAYEFKWKDQKVKTPVAWKKAYPNSEFQVISQDNYFDWIAKG